MKPWQRTATAGVLPQHEVDYGVTLNLAELKIDPQAQRTLNERRAQTMADTLVPEAIGSIVVSERVNGDRYIVDGMHRGRASGLNGLTTIVGEVHHNLSQQEEAILFLIKNRESNKPNPLDEYKVGLTAGLPLFIDTDKVLKSHGLDVGSTSANSVGAVSGILRITDDYGPDILDRVLTIAEESWGLRRKPGTASSSGAWACSSVAMATSSLTRSSRRRSRSPAPRSFGSVAYIRAPAAAV